MRSSNFCLGCCYFCCNCSSCISLQKDSLFVNGEKQLLLYRLLPLLFRPLQQGRPLFQWWDIVVAVKVVVVDAPVADDSSAARTPSLVRICGCGCLYFCCWCCCCCGNGITLQQGHPFCQWWEVVIYNDAVSAVYAVVAVAWSSCLNSKARTPSLSTVCFATVLILVSFVAAAAVVVTYVVADLCCINDSLFVNGNKLL